MADHREPARVWPFQDAPEELRALSGHGGDEDWLVHIPAGWGPDFWVPWADDDFRGEFGICDVSVHDLPDGSQVRIGAHA